MPWKMAAAFWLVGLAMGPVAFALQELGWYDLSTRFFAYMVLCAVGFAISWACLAIVNTRRLLGRRTVESE